MLVQQINDDYHFWTWLKQSDNYRNNFSLEGAKALQEYLVDMNHMEDRDTDFDPIAWCCEFGEYDNWQDAWNERGDTMDDCDDELDIEATREWFQDMTTVIELDNGHIILGEF